MNSRKIWSSHGNKFHPADISATVEKIPMGVYTIHRDAFGIYSLERQSDQFSFDFKVYGLETDLIRRVVTYYGQSKGNLGVLLNGKKGTGKSVTAKILANALQNPILLIQQKTKGLIDFLNGINQDMTVLIDEYEKIFGGKYDRENNEVVGDADLLGIMDGTIQSAYRRTWILTTNELWINENLLNRPGRIRYKKQFNDLDLATINEVIADTLEYPAHQASILEYCKTLELITVDILKAIVKEVNLFNETPMQCCSIMNIKVKEDRYSFIILNNGIRLLTLISISEMESIKREIKAGNVFDSSVQNLIHPIYEEEIIFKEKIPGKDEYIFNRKYEDKNGQEQVDVIICGWKQEKFMHRAFGYV